MKNILFYTFFFLSIGSLFAQSNEQGNININIGAGFEPTFFDDSTEVDIVPLHMSADYSINSLVSVGLSVVFSGSTRELIQSARTITETVGFTQVGLRGNFHVPIPLNTIDLYVGGFIGAEQRKESFQSDDPTFAAPTSIKGWSFRPEGHVGLRYRLGGFIAVYAEGSYGLSLVQAGINFRL